ncbi:MAG: phosphoadenosine phosphosulfate reductase family protein [Desulfurococcales archaeon]|nr:phosphoadenosine phosphosulfate reductase family protein [Desulfurococcales archaeon]
MTVKVLVRSKRDADAVKASLEKFPETTHWTVKSLGGVRGGKLYDSILDEIEPFSIILLGWEDREIHEKISQLTLRIPFTASILARTKKVRNSTIEMINALFSRARAIIRMRTLWNGTYVLSGWREGEPIEVPMEPYGDAFFLYGKGSMHALKVLGLPEPDNGDAPILYAVKLAKGLHYIYSGNELIGEIYMNNHGLRPHGKSIKRNILVKKHLDVSELINTNKPIIDILVKESKSYLQNIAHYDKKIVPLSGGKDSAAALLLALEEFNRDEITAIYVDTGIDFDENRDYVINLTSKLNIDLIIVEAGVDKGLLSGYPLPTPNNRWCTARKLAALKKAIERISSGKRIALIVGDRDSESDRRSRRPLLRVDKGLPYPTIAPLRLWSAAHVMVFLWSRNIGVNPLYDYGFYRTGCYVCFSLRSWELSIMNEHGILDRIMNRKPHHETFIKRFLEEKSRDS